MLLRDIVGNLYSSYRESQEKINVVFRIDDNITVEFGQALHLGLIINELVSNSLKYAFVGANARGDTH